MAKEELEGSLGSFPRIVNLFCGNARSGLAEKLGIIVDARSGLAAGTSGLIAARQGLFATTAGGAKGRVIA